MNKTYSYDYINMIRKYPNVDIVFVDGRYRVACGAIAYDYLKKDGVLVVHDFNRKQYHILLKFYYVEKSADILAILRKRNKIDRLR